MSDTEIGGGAFVDTGSERLIGRIDGAIGWIVFNNPARHNAVSLDMWAALDRVLGVFATEPEVRVVILTGAGGKAFVSGADLTEFGAKRDNPEDNEIYTAVSGKARRALTDFTKPLVAMIDGYCIGGGLVIALGCDVRIASDRSRFGIPAAKLGLGYGLGGVVDLVDLVGPGAAKDILFSARTLSADEALRIGLVSQVTDPAKLASVVEDYASTIARNAPLTVQAAKLAVAAALQTPADRNSDAVAAAVKDCFQSADYREGRAAFAEKRAPRFRGR